MYVSKSIIDEGIQLLDENEDVVLRRLGSEIYSLERHQPAQILIDTVPDANLRQRALLYLDSKRRSLKEVICPHWQARKREDLVDTAKLLSYVVDLVMKALGMSQTYVTTAMLIAVLIVKQGIDAFCRQKALLSTE